MTKFSPCTTELMQAANRLRKALEGFNQALFDASFSPSALQSAKEDIALQLGPQTYFLAYLLSDNPVFLGYFFKARDKRQKHNRQLLKEFNALEEKVNANGGLDDRPEVKARLEAFKARLLRANGKEQ